MPRTGIRHFTRRRPAGTARRMLPKTPTAALASRKFKLAA